LIISKSTWFSAVFSFDRAFWLFAGGKKKRLRVRPITLSFAESGATDTQNQFRQCFAITSLLRWKKKKGSFFHSVSAGAGKSMLDNRRIFSYAFSKQENRRFRVFGISMEAPTGPGFFSNVPNKLLPGFVRDPAGILF